ncbi:uncharacterized protein LOC113305915 [Papaver somniferum]|uniref:uncharacterized protein LOC113305915 n=1 Tax=Papaver somniferum TaxID=3469 RepID=UPI000E6F66C4|nr:uncharacterized protein LOC113305915 [Papaver somniferum]
MAIKLDLSKAFDRLEWVFIIEVFRKLGFSEDWCQIIFQCISSVSYSVLINGSPGEDFAPSRGIRQGDCISTYIFILCMEILSQMLLKAESDNTIHGFRIRKNSPSITHLFFADDCMLFFKDSIVYARNLMQILNKFAKASGQDINFDKSGFFTSSNMHHKHVKLLSRTLGIKYLSSSVKYLGTPLFINRDRTRTFQFLTDKFYARLGNMKKTNLNVAGRTVVTKHVLSSLASYHMSSWRLTQFPDHLISVYLKDKYFPNQNLLEIDKAADSSSWIWKGIVKSISFLKMNIVIKINNGRSTRIWSSNWLPYSAAPPLSASLNYLNYTFVYELIDQQQGSWNVGFLHNLFCPEDVVKISTIRLNLLCQDKIKWTHTKDGNFIIKSSYKVYTNDYCSAEDSAFWEKILLVLSSRMTVRQFFISSFSSLWFDIRIGPSPFPVGWTSIGSIVMWCIWKLRCEVVFQNVAINFDKVIRNSRRMITTYINPPTEIICRKDVRTPRTDVRHIFFLDGSFKKFNMGVGLILCDVTGRIECSRSDFGLVQDAVSAEATALVLAISWVRELNLSKVLLVSDCLQVVDFLNGDCCSAGWRCGDLLAECRSFMSRSGVCRLVYIRRVKNKLADRLARRARRLYLKDSWSSLPPFMNCYDRDENIYRPLSLPINQHQGLFNFTSQSINREFTIQITTYPKLDVGGGSDGDGVGGVAVGAGGGD